MLVAPRCLLVRIEALGNDQHELILGAGHGDVEQAPLLLDILRTARPQVGGDAAVDGVEDEDAPPFLALGGVYVDKIR